MMYDDDDDDEDDGGDGGGGGDLTSGFLKIGVLWCFTLCHWFLPANTDWGDDPSSRWFQ